MYSSTRVQSAVEQLTLLNPFANETGLPEVQRPSEGFIPRQRPVIEQIPFIQQILNQLSYNFLPQTFFSLDKYRSLQSILLSGKNILADSLPIRCLEATFVSIYLTQCLKEVDRIPLSFKSRARGHTYHHIVLALKLQKKYGAIGLSRQASLMDKPMSFTSLTELVAEYQSCYKKVGHELVSVRIGLFVSHDWYSHRIPCWRFVTLSIPDGAEAMNGEVGQLIGNLERLLPLLSEQYQTLPLQLISPSPVTPSRTQNNGNGSSSINGGGGTPPSSVPNSNATAGAMAQPMSQRKSTRPQTTAVVKALKPNGGGGVSTEASLSTSTKGVLETPAQVDEDNGIEVEENRRRIRAIAAMVSPWAAPEGTISPGRKALCKGTPSATHSNTPPRRHMGAPPSAGAAASAAGEVSEAAAVKFLTGRAGTYESSFEARVSNSAPYARDSNVGSCSVASSRLTNGC